MTEHLPTETNITELLDQYVEARHNLDVLHNSLRDALGGLVGKFISVSGFPSTVGVAVQEPDSAGRQKLSFVPAYRFTTPETERKLFVLPVNKVVNTSHRGLTVEALTADGHTMTPPRQYRFTLNGIVALSQIPELPTPEASQPEN
ncbi:MAG: hypothetical protein QFB87_03075 [Patescibacteria group bacterium]|nr:hypothetical protein [Patescibacteria group bacterium]